MKAILLSMTLCLAMAMAVPTKNCEEKCKSCKVLDRKMCLAGTEKDGECGCCDVCKRFEGQQCDKLDAPFKHGHCGYGLECKKAASGGDICQCIWDEIVCGTDGRTYTNMCHLMAATLRGNMLNDLKVKAIGPCSPGAQIVTKPEYVRNTTNSDVVLACEAIGFPTPIIKWSMTRANGKTYEMPGDDNYLVTTMRGGPGKYQITGWLQIEGLQKRHEGDYTCIASNEQNTDEAKARVKVVSEVGEGLGPV